MEKVKAKQANVIEGTYATLYSWGKGGVDISFNNISVNGPTIICTFTFEKMKPKYSTFMID